MKKNRTLALFLGAYLLFYSIFTLHALAFEAAEEIRIERVSVRSLNEEQCVDEACIAKKKDPLCAAGLNFIPLGYGSFLQGDDFGGYSIAIVDSIGFSFILLGSLSTLSSGGGSGGYFSSVRYPTTGPSLQDLLNGFGFMWLVLGRFMGLIAPFAYHHKYLINLRRNSQQEQLSPDNYGSPSNLIRFDFVF